VIGGIVLGAVAIGLGIGGRGRANRREATNGGSATAGIVMGALGLILSIVLVVAGVALLNTPAGKTLRACLKSANGNTTAVSQCQAQYANNH
jgi:predicted metalloprotease